MTDSKSRDAYIISSALRRTSKTLRETLIECDILEVDIDLLDVETCDNCEIWYSKHNLTRDRDGNWVCGFCKLNCGE